MCVCAGTGVWYAGSLLGDTGSGSAGTEMAQAEFGLGSRPTSHDQEEVMLPC